MSAPLSAAEEEHREDRALHDLPALEDDQVVAHALLRLCAARLRGHLKEREALEETLHALVDEFDALDESEREAWDHFARAARMKVQADEAVRVAREVVVF